MPNENTFFEKFVLHEIEGKNEAIHGYDKIIWIIRSGFLTLVFACWAILLQGMSGKECVGNDSVCLSLGMLFISVGLAIVGWFVDRDYLRRKFRVIKAKNQITEDILQNGGNAFAVQAELLKILGSSNKCDYDTDDYRRAGKVGKVVYFAPILMLLIAFCLYFALAWGSNLDL